MKIEIILTPTPDGGVYSWTLYTGPSGIDKFSGECKSLGECFEKIVMEETRNAYGYYEYNG